MKTKKMILGSLLMVLSLSAALASSTCIQINPTCWDLIPCSGTGIGYDIAQVYVNIYDKDGDPCHVSFACQTGSTIQGIVNWNNSTTLTQLAGGSFIDFNNPTVYPMLTNDGQHLIIYCNYDDDYTPTISVFDYQVNGNWNLLYTNHDNENWSSDPTGANPSSACNVFLSKDEKYIALVYIPESGDQSLHSRCGTINYSTGKITWTNGHSLNANTGISHLSCSMNDAGNLILHYIANSNEYLQEGTFDGKGDITWNPVQGK